MFAHTNWHDLPTPMVAHVETLPAVNLQGEREGKRRDELACPVISQCKKHAVEMLPKKYVCAESGVLNPPCMHAHTVCERGVIPGQPQLSEKRVSKAYADPELFQKTPAYRRGDELYANQRVPEQSEGCHRRIPQLGETKHTHTHTHTHTHAHAYLPAGGLTAQEHTGAVPALT